MASPLHSPPSSSSSSSSSFPRDYAGSLAALDSTQQRGAALRRAYDTRTRCLEAMCIYLERIGLREEALARVLTLHVTGSKGKGSTCAFVEAILRAKGLKTVLFTSPHLVKVNERIRLDGRPLPDALWTKHFWAVWDRLHQHMPAGDEGAPKEDDDAPDPLPGYFRLLTLLCLWVAVAEQADALILEVGVGGRYDATNVVPPPLACGVTRLDLEHTEMLGDSLAKIAWEKGGVVKRGGGPCFVGEQAPEAGAEGLPVLRDCAREAGVPLRRVRPLSSRVQLGMLGDFQRGNAAVAVALAEHLLAHQPVAANGGAGHTVEEEGKEEELSVDGLVEGDPVIAAALAECSWPGRCQRVAWRGCRLFIDGAHTEQSMQAAVAWFDEQAAAVAGTATAAAAASAPASPRCLVFHCGEEKAVGELLTHLISLPRGQQQEQQQQQQLARFGLVVFCPVASARPTLATVRPARELVLASGEGQGQEERQRLTALCDALEAAEEKSQQQAPGSAPAQPWQRALRGAWRVLQAAQLQGPADSLGAARALLARADALTETAVRPSVAAALEEVAGRAASPSSSSASAPLVLVTGSLYLVGNTLGVVQEEEGPPPAPSSS